MKLRDLFTKLSYGELSNLSMSGEANGTIAEASHPRLIHAVNDALKDMFSRLHLYERELLIQSLEWKAIYYLRKEHAMMDPTVGPLKYIVDTPQNLFTGDVVKVLSVANEVGANLPLNDATQWASVFTPYFDTVQLNHPGADQVFSVTYQALHPELLVEVAEDDDVLEQDIRVPSILEEMLRLKVAQGIFSPMSGQDFTVKAQQLEAAYELRYIELGQKNLVGDLGMNTNVKIHCRGFP